MATVYYNGQIRVGTLGQVLEDLRRKESPQPATDQVSALDILAQAMRDLNPKPGKLNVFRIISEAEVLASYRGVYPGELNSILASFGDGNWVIQLVAIPADVRRACALAGMEIDPGSRLLYYGSNKEADEANKL